MTAARSRLVVPDPDEAISFHRTALDAELRERYTSDDGALVVHALLAVGSASFSLAAEVAEWGLLAPTTIGGSASLVTLEVDDAPAVARRMVRAGTEVVIPIEDRPYGRCEGRVRDPFGHLWIPTHSIADGAGPADAGGARRPGVRRIVADLRTGGSDGVVSFYRDVFDLEVLMDLDGITTLGTPGAPSVQVTFLDDDDDAGAAPVAPAISIEVDDLDEVERRAQATGRPFVHPRTREAWGVERFFIEDPAGNVVNVLRHLP